MLLQATWICGILGFVLLDDQQLVSSKALRLELAEADDRAGQLG